MRVFAIDSVLKALNSCSHADAKLHSSNKMTNSVLE